MSAAHCTRTLAAGSTTVLVGSVSRLTGGTSYGISRIVNHVAFDARLLENDISLLETASQVLFTNTVQAINIGSGSIGSGVSVTIVGFGQTATTGGLAETLQWITAPTITNTSCRSRFSITNAARVQNEHVCTLSPVGQG